MPIGNMAMRGASLAARFGLSIYMARALGYEALGMFGLIAGVAGVAPALLGFGVSYHLNRDILLQPRSVGYRLLRDRMAMSLSAAALLWLVGVPAVMFGPLPHPPYLWISAAIVTLELVAFDLHIALINLQRPIAANFLLFVRSASWIVPVIMLGLADPQFRTLDLILECWLAALVVNFSLFLVIIRDAPIAALLHLAIDWQALMARARRTPLIYANDLAGTGQTYLDRFIVAQLLGMAATGVYTLYFAVAQGLYVLVASAVTQMSMPKLMAVREEEGLLAWRAALASEGRRAAMVAVPLVVCTIVITLLLLPAWGYAEFRREPALFALMSITALAKPFADLANTALYSLSEDRALALINLGGVAMSVGSGLLCLALFGLAGIGLSGLATQGALICGRAMVVRRRLIAAN